MPIEVRHLSNHTHVEYENKNKNKNKVSVKTDIVKENNNSSSNNSLTHPRVVKLGESSYKNLSNVQGNF